MDKVPFDDVLEECRKKKFDDASQWSLEDRISILIKGAGTKKRFQYSLNPNSSNPSIQGNPGGNAINPELHDDVLLPEGFTEYIYLVGNVSELNSIIRKWIDSGWRLVPKEDSDER